MHIKQVVRILSYLMLFIALIMLVPAAVGLMYNEGPSVKAFTLTSGLLILLSTIGIFFFRNAKGTNFSQRDGYLFTSLAWIFATAAGAIPMVISGTIPHYSSAFFEIMSGFTTTGATKLDQVENCYKSILLWRSLTNWLGGMGIVVLFVALLPALGSGASSFNLIGAETVGPVKGKLTPKTKNTSIILWVIYVGVTLVEIVLLLFSKIGLFDAVTIAFSTVSTAGFSVKNASIGAYGSAYIEVVVTLFMIIAAVNFSLYYKAFTGHISEVWKDTEFKWILTIVASSSVFGAIALVAKHTYPNFFTALRYMAFHIASVISTTGFSTADIYAWPSFCMMLIIGMMFVGGCAGSTGGGIKVIRLAIAGKSSINSLKNKIHPNGVFTVRVNNERVGSDVVSSIFNFIVVYIATWLFGAIVISLTGADIADCLSSSILTLGNIGLGFTPKAFSSFPLWTDWVFSFLMFVGRLELFTVYVLFSKSFWKR